MDCYASNDSWPGFKSSFSSFLSGKIDLDCLSWFSLLNEKWWFIAKPSVWKKALMSGMRKMKWICHFPYKSQPCQIFFWIMAAAKLTFVVTWRQLISRLISHRLEAKSDFFIWTKPTSKYAASLGTNRTDKSAHLLYLLQYAGNRVKMMYLPPLVLIFLKVAQAGGRTWDLLIFVYFLSQLQCLRPLGYCVSFRILNLRLKTDRKGKLQGRLFQGLSLSKNCLFL